jgi:hypothetical protein
VIPEDEKDASKEDARVSSRAGDLSCLKAAVVNAPQSADLKRER